LLASAKPVDQLPDEKPGLQIYNILSSLGSFERVCNDSNLNSKMNPKILKFLLSEAWLSEDIIFGVLISRFFQIRKSMHSKFQFKLYNTLLLTHAFPKNFRFIGVRWVTNDILLVDGLILRNY
jgi:hypothetical protein